MKTLLLTPFLFVFFLTSGYTKLQAQLIQTVAGNGIQGYTGDGGPALSAEINNPLGFSMDAAGNMYVCDEIDNKIRKISTNGIITCIAGTGAQGYGGDGGQATAAKLYWPYAVTFDAAGNLYFPGCYNNRIRKINTSGIISTVAGNGTLGSGGDGGPATSASLYNPNGVAFDASGNMYIADGTNNKIRKVSVSGIITTFAGTGNPGYGGDGGPATSASLFAPVDMVFDTQGNMYVADDLNHRIRKIDASGTITTFAGTGVGGYSGDLGQATSAKLNYPTHVKFDNSGNLYFTDEGSQVIRVISPSGVISTLAGNGTQGFSGDGGPAIAAELNTPDCIAFDSFGNLYFGDSNNNRIRKVTLNTGIQTTETNETGFSIYPNPVSDEAYLTITTQSSAPALVSICNMFGETVFSEKIMLSDQLTRSIRFTEYPAGVYFISIHTQQQTLSRKLVKH